MTRWLALMIALLTLTGGMFAEASTCPVQVGAWLDGRSNAVAITGDVVFYNRGARLVIADLASPILSVLGELVLPAQPTELVVDDDVVYLTSSSRHVGAVDVSDLTRPVLLSWYQTGDELDYLAAASGLLVAGGLSGVTVFDASDPAQLRPTAFEPCSFLMDVAMEGHYAYLADEYLRIIDLSDPARPIETGSYFSLGWNKSVAVADGIVHLIGNELSDRMIRLYTILDVSDPGHPVTLSSLADDPGEGVFSSYENVAVAGSLSAFMDDDSLQLNDISNPRQPRKLSSVTIPGYSRTRTPLALGDRMAVVGNQTVYTVQPSVPWLGPVLDASGSFISLEVVGEHGFVLANEVYPWTTLKLFDLADPMRPSLVNEIQVMPALESVSTGTRLVTVGLSQVNVYDISNAEAPQLLGSCVVPYWGPMAAAADHVYLIPLRNGTLKTIDISNPQAPRVVSSVGSLSHATDVAVAGDLVLVSTEEGLALLDATTPSQPVRGTTLVLNGDGKAVAASDQYAYVGVETPVKTGMVYAVDLADPYSPYTTYTLPLGEPVTSLRYANGLIWAGIESGTVAIEHGPAGLVVAGFVPARQSSIRPLTATTVAMTGVDGLRIYDLSCASQTLVVRFDFQPSVAHVGQAVQLIDRSIGPINTWTWFFPDGSTSKQPHPLHTFTTPGLNQVTLTAASSWYIGSVTKQILVQDTDETGVTAVDDDRKYRYVVPAVAHTDGTSGTSWLTDVTLFNGDRGGASEVTLYLLESDQDNRDATGHRFKVPTNDILHLGDLVQKVFDRQQTTGALLVTSSEELLVASRTYNNAPSGTYGQYIQGERVELAIDGQEPAWLMMLSEDSSSRSNLGLVNLEEVVLEVDVELLAASGAHLAQLEISVPPYGHVQRNRILREAGAAPVADAFAIVTARSSHATYFVYASVIDALSGDPICLVPGTASTDPIYLLAAANNDGINGTRWRTDTEVCNPEQSSARYRIELLPEPGVAAPAPVELELEPESCRRHVDTIGELLGFAGSGALRVTPLEGAVMAVSRTYNQTDQRGTYGQLIPPASLTRWDYLIHLYASSGLDAGFRTNIGVVNHRESEESCTFTFGDHMFDLDFEVSYRFAPLSFNQKGNVFSSITGQVIGPSWVHCYCPEQLFAYASVVDNRSGDPIFILPRRPDQWW